MSVTLVGLCGALRRGSTNRLLLGEAVRHFAPATWAEGDLRLPLFDADIQAEQGIPPEVARLAEAIRTADAVVIASPEYNKAPSGVLKNALDWVSRVPGGVWRDKPVAIVSAAAGRSGGERGQAVLRLMLAPFRAHVLPGPEVLVAGPDAFDADGRLVSERYAAPLAELMADLRAAALARQAQG